MKDFGGAFGMDVHWFRLTRVFLLGLMVREILKWLIFRLIQKRFFKTLPALRSLQLLVNLAAGSSKTQILRFTVGLVNNRLFNINKIICIRHFG